MTQKVQIRFHSRAIFEQMECRQLFSAGVEALVADALYEERVLPSTPQFIEQSLSNTGDEKHEQVSTSRHELIIIDGNIDNYETLLEDIVDSDLSQDRNIEVIVLDNNRDGLSQINDALSGLSNLDAVHIISHGDEGRIHLANSVIDESSLITNLESVSRWGDALTSNGEFLIYGCNLASTAAGQDMVDTLAALTDTDVAASDDITGNLSQGGDWELEYQIGNIETDSSLF